MKSTKIAHIVVILAITLFSILIQGYTFLGSDSSVYLPLLDQESDPILFQNDIYVTNANEIFIPTLKISSLFNNHIEIFLFLVHLISRLILVISVFLLANLLFNKKVGYLSAFFIASISGVLNFGGFDIVQKAVTFSLIAIPFAVLTIYYFLKEKKLIYLILLILTTYIHTTIGLSLFGMLMFVLLFTNRKELLISALIYIILTLPVLLNSMSNFFVSYNVSLWFEYIRFRLGHHHFFSEIPLWDYLEMLILLAFMLISLKFLKTKFNKVKLMLISLLILFIVGFVAIEFLEMPLFLSLTPMRALIFFRIFAIIFMSAFILKYFNKDLLKQGLSFVMLIFLLGAVFAPSFYGSEKGLIKPINLTAVHDPDWMDVTLWAKNNTPKDSLFLVNPFLTHFRYFSQRSNYVNWKISGWTIYSKSYFNEVYPRLDYLCNVSQFTDRTSFVEFCSNHYSQLTESEIPPEIDYVIFEKPKDLNLSKVYENNKFVVYLA